MRERALGGLKEHYIGDWLSKERGWGEELGRRAGERDRGEVLWIGAGERG